MTEYDWNRLMQILDDMEEYEIFDKAEIDGMRGFAMMNESYAKSLLKQYQHALYNMEQKKQGGLTAALQKEKKL